jgi:hypothetical protein
LPDLVALLASAGYGPQPLPPDLTMYRRVGPALAWLKGDSVRAVGNGRSSLAPRSSSLAPAAVIAP